MLVLSRRPEEKILLPTVSVLIKVLSVQTNLVRLGFDAPQSVPVLREELLRPDRPMPPTAAHVALGNLLMGLEVLRVQMADGDAAVKQTLDGIEQELEALRAALGAPELVAAR